MPDRYSNLFLNAYMKRHANTECLKIIEVYSPLGIWHVFLYSINTNIRDKPERDVIRRSRNLLLDFSLTVKAATSIFISGCGLAISSAKEG